MGRLSSMVYSEAVVEVEEVEEPLRSRWARSVGPGLGALSGSCTMTSTWYTVAKPTTAPSRHSRLLGTHKEMFLS